MQKNTTSLCIGCSGGGTQPMSLSQFFLEPYGVPPDALCMCGTVLVSDATWMEDTALAQLITTSQLSGMQRIAGMADFPPGRGYPVGATFFQPGSSSLPLVGKNIGCGMAL